MLSVSSSLPETQLPLVAEFSVADGEAFNGTAAAETAPALQNAQGSQVIASFATGGTIDYQIDAFDGGILAITLAETSNSSSDEDLYVRIIAPNNAVVYDSGSTSNINSLNIPLQNTQAGTYSVLISDFQGDDPGQVRIRAVALPGSAQSVLINGQDKILANGEQVTTSFPVGGFSIFQLEATAGDALDIVVSETTNAVSDEELYLMVIAPNGAVVFDSGTRRNISSWNLPLRNTQLGTYTVLVSDFQADDPGEIQIRAAALPGDSQPVIINGQDKILANGEQTTATFPAGGFSLFQIDAAAGNALEVVIAETTDSGSDEELYVTIVAPNGSVVYDSGSTRHIGSLNIALRNTQAGTYTVVVSDYQGDDSGEVRIRAVAMPGTSQPVIINGQDKVLANGEQATASFPAGGFSLFQIDAAAASALEFLIAETTDTGSDEELYVTIVAPNGAVVFDSGSTRGIHSLNIPLRDAQAGIYTVKVTDFQGDEPGEVRVRAAALPGNAQPVIINGQDKILTNGQTATGAFPTGGFSLFQIDATAGGNLEVIIAETTDSGSDEELYINVVAPNGFVVYDSGNTTDISARELFFQNTLAGTYSIVVSDFHGDTPGEVRVTAGIDNWRVPRINLQTTSRQTALPGGPVRLLPFATVSDLDAGDLNGFRADVRIVAGQKSYDRLWLLDESGQRLAAGASIILSGVNVGTVTETGFAVRVVLNSNANFNHLRSIYNRIEYENVGTNVTSDLIGPRTLAMRVIDTDSRIDIAYYNLDVKGKPTISLETTASKTALPGAPLRLLPFATVIDPDAGNLDGFRADVRIVAGRKAYDRIWLLDEAGQRLSAGASIVLSGVNVGTVTENGLAVRITLNSNANLNHLRHLYNRVEYENVGSNPTIDLVGKRVLAMRVIDTDTLFDIAYYNVYVQGRPVINLGSTSGTTAIPGTPYRLLPFATVKDIDAASLDGYRVDMYFDAGRKAYDRLWLLGENGQRLNNDDALILNGVTVGTVVESGLRVKVLFNANATLYDARVVYNRIEYENLGSTSDPSLLGTRRLELRVRDVDGNSGSAYYDLDVTGSP